MTDWMHRASQPAGAGGAVGGAALALSEGARTARIPSVEAPPAVRRGCANPVSTIGAEFRRLTERLPAGALGNSVTVAHLTLDQLV